MCLRPGPADACELASWRLGVCQSLEALDTGILEQGLSVGDLWSLCKCRTAGLGTLPMMVLLFCKPCTALHDATLPKAH